jgi:hypothetical protein
VAQTRRAVRVHDRPPRVAIEPATFGGARRRLRRRLLDGGLYADEPRLRDLLESRFAIESLDRFVSEAHLHCLCVARLKP